MKELDITNVHKDPFEQFRKWYSVIEKEGEENYNAVALSSASDKGRISSRIVLLKSYDNDGFVFYTNYLSKKGWQLSLNPLASLLFYWPGQRRQVRIEGSVIKTSPEESGLYFDSRIHDHKLNAIVSKQSAEIFSKEELVEKYNMIISKSPSHSPERPDHWGGYRLVPDLMEFWQEGSFRFHDRIEYLLSDGKWNIRRLSP